MREDIRIAKEKADKAVILYKKNLISRSECEKSVKPYLDLVNETSVKIAKKYKQRPKVVQFSSYIR